MIKEIVKISKDDVQFVNRIDKKTRSELLRRKEECHTEYASRGIKSITKDLFHPYWRESKQIEEKQYENLLMTLDHVMSFDEASEICFSLRPGGSFDMCFPNRTENDIICFAYHIVRTVKLDKNAKKMHVELNAICGDYVQTVYVDIIAPEKYADYCNGFHETKCVVVLQTDKIGV